LLCCALFTCSLTLLMLEFLNRCLKVLVTQMGMIPNPDLHPQNQHYKDFQAHLRVSKMSDSSSLSGLNLDNILGPESRLLPQHIQAGWGQHRQTCQTWDMKSDYQACHLHYVHMVFVTTLMSLGLPKTQHFLLSRLSIWTNFLRRKSRP